MFAWLIASLLSVSVEATNCQAINGGNSNAPSSVTVFANTGWYRGYASPFSSFKFLYNSPVAESFRITIVDAFCPGDGYVVSIVTPSNNEVLRQMISLSPIQCNSPFYTIDPNVAFANPLYSQVGVTIVFLVQAGLWTFTVTPPSFCAPGGQGNLGVFLRIDIASYTGSVCSFASTVFSAGAKMVEYCWSLLG